MTNKGATYELREGRLYVEGEPVGIDRRLIATVLARCRAESGLASSECGPILSWEEAERILHVDRVVGLCRLKAALTAPPPIAG
jgi:hypothetical protein